MNLSADIKLTSVSSNDVQLVITVQLFKQTKMVKICFDWNQCKSLHNQSLSLGVVGSGNGVVYLTSPGRLTEIGLQLGKACYPCSW